MTRRSGMWSGWSLAALALLTAGGCGGGPPPQARPVSAYPRSPSLDAMTSLHAEAAADAEQRLLLTTWFHHGDPRVSLVCGVAPDGKVTTYTYMHEAGAIQSGGKAVLVPDQVAELKAVLDSLPPSGSPPLENLLIVSYRTNAGWATHTYDRTHPPRSVARLFEITRAPLQPRPSAASDQPTPDPG